MQDLSWLITRFVAAHGRFGVPLTDLVDLLDSATTGNVRGSAASADSVAPLDPAPESEDNSPGARPTPLEWPRVVDCCFEECAVAPPTRCFHPEHDQRRSGDIARRCRELGLARGCRALRLAVADALSQSSLSVVRVHDPAALAKRAAAIAAFERVLFADFVVQSKSRQPDAAAAPRDAVAGAAAHRADDAAPPLPQEAKIAQRRAPMTGDAERQLELLHAVRDFALAPLGIVVATPQARTELAAHVQRLCATPHAESAVAPRAATNAASAAPRYFVVATLETIKAMCPNALTAVGFDLLLAAGRVGMPRMTFNRMMPSRDAGRALQSFGSAGLIVERRVLALTNSGVSREATDPRIFIRECDPFALVEPAGAARLARVEGGAQFADVVSMHPADLMARDQLPFLAPPVIARVARGIFVEPSKPVALDRWHAHMHPQLAAMSDTRALVPVLTGMGFWVTMQRRAPAVRTRSVAAAAGTVGLRDVCVFAPRAFVHDQLVSGVAVRSALEGGAAAADATVDVPPVSAFSAQADALLNVFGAASPKVRCLRQPVAVSPDAPLSATIVDLALAGCGVVLSEACPYIVEDLEDLRLEEEAKRRQRAAVRGTVPNVARVKMDQGRMHRVILVARTGAAAAAAAMSSAEVTLSILRESIVAETAAIVRQHGVCRMNSAALPHDMQTIRRIAAELVAAPADAPPLGFALQRLHDVSTSAQPVYVAYDPAKFGSGAEALKADADQRAASLLKRLRAAQSVRKAAATSVSSSGTDSSGSGASSSDSDGGDGDDAADADDHVDGKGRTAARRAALNEKATALRVAELRGGQLKDNNLIAFLADSRRWGAIGCAFPLLLALWDIVLTRLADAARTASGAPAPSAVVLEVIDVVKELPLSVACSLGVADYAGVVAETATVEDLAAPLRDMRADLRKRLFPTDAAREALVRHVLHTLTWLAKKGFVTLLGRVKSFVPTARFSLCTELPAATLAVSAASVLNDVACAPRSFEPSPALWMPRSPPLSPHERAELRNAFTLRLMRVCDAVDKVRHTEHAAITARSSFARSARARDVAERIMSTVFVGHRLPPLPVLKGMCALDPSSFPTAALPAMHIAVERPLRRFVAALGEPAPEPGLTRDERAKPAAGKPAGRIAGQRRMRGRLTALVHAGGEAKADISAGILKVVSRRVRTALAVATGARRHVRNRKKGTRRDGEEDSVTSDSSDSSSSSNSSNSSSDSDSESDGDGADNDAGSGARGGPLANTMAQRRLRAAALTAEDLDKLHDEFLMLYAVVRHNPTVVTGPPGTAASGCEAARSWELADDAGTTDTRLAAAPAAAAAAAPAAAAAHDPVEAARDLIVSMLFSRHDLVGGPAWARCQELLLAFSAETRKRAIEELIAHGVVSRRHDSAQRLRGLTACRALVSRWFPVVRGADFPVRVAGARGRLLAAAPGSAVDSELQAHASAAVALVETVAAACLGVAHSDSPAATVPLPVADLTRFADSMFAVVPVKHEPETAPDAALGPTMAAKPPLTGVIAGTTMEALRSEIARATSCVLPTRTATADRVLLDSAVAVDSVLRIDGAAPDARGARQSAVQARLAQIREQVRLETLQVPKNDELTAALDAGVARGTPLLGMGFREREARSRSGVLCAFLAGPAPPNDAARADAAAADAAQLPAPRGVLWNVDGTRNDAALTLLLTVVCELVIETPGITEHDILSRLRVPHDITAADVRAALTLLVDGSMLQRVPLPTLDGASSDDLPPWVRARAPRPASVADAVYYLVNTDRAPDATLLA
jgi:hypothetical protein